ncbi:MAG TPA: glycosyltransferase [Gaiellaceae bacterium]|nr:glycosyltransferase [Gaiellaceae bacterium]
MEGAALRILFAAPAWWPAVAFGGPIPVTKELSERLAGHGHDVSVVTTTLVDLHSRPAAHTHTETHDGVRVTYLATPVSYRWMGITPTLPVVLERAERPDVVHVLGFRDVVSTGVAAWARLRDVPYVFEPLGMFEPRLRKVPLKRALDATLYRGVASGASAVVVSSEREGGHVRAGGVPPDRVRVRGNGFPDPESMPAGRGVLRGEVGVPDGVPIVLYVGRIASGKGIEHLLAAARELRDAHVVLVGPDDRHGAIDQVRAAQATGRVHTLGATAEPPLHLYKEADVLCLPSAGESFGMAAAEAAAAGTPVVVTDRCGIASFFRDGEALVVPYGAEALTGALRRVLGDGELRERLSAGGVAAARRMSWEHVTDHQEEIYREAIAS